MLEERLVIKCGRPGSACLPTEAPRLLCMKRNAGCAVDRAAAWPQAQEWR